MNADYEKTREDMFNDIKKSHDILGIANSALFSYCNMNFFNENHRDMVESIEAKIREFEPDFIFTHNATDLHSDHRITSMVTQQAARLWQRHSKGHKVKGLYFMEVLSSTNWGCDDFKPDTYVEVSPDDMEAKVAALTCYKNVVRPDPHPRSIRNIYALSYLRGSDIGYLHAEAFQTCWRDCL
jgi:LmbE family N-acetylglucosaminyl deacetylase